jgi:phage FluMu protein Com
MSQKIEMRCQQCGHFLFNKIIPERKGEKEYGGIQIPCPNCKTVNIFGVKHEQPSFGEKMNYHKKSA